VSKARGKASSNRKLAEDVQERAIGLVRDRYADFGPAEPWMTTREKLAATKASKVAFEKHVESMPSNRSRRRHARVRRQDVREREGLKSRES
jgi:hypothetical protein